MTKKLEWITVQRCVGDLIPQEVNPRKITDKQMNDLKKSLKRYNLAEIPAINLDGRILAGHQRITALQLLGRGEEMIDVRIPNRHLSKEESDGYLIGSNAIGGSWDFNLMKSFNLDFLLDVGMDEITLSKGWDTDKKIKEDNLDIDKEIKKNKNPKTKLGDIIYLGRHIIICGDSTKLETLRNFPNKIKVSMVYSDPIYNLKGGVSYRGGVGGKKDYGADVDDNRTYDEYYKFIEDSLKAVLSIAAKNLHIFYWCDQIYIGLIQDIFRKLGLDNRRVCLWIKNGHNPVPGVAFNKCYEPCVYAIQGKPYLAENQTKFNEVLNTELTTGNEMFDAVDVWLAKRLPGQEMEHATSKPISLAEKAIKRCTKVNDIIFDSFLGSGSTLLCAEELGRVVYGCELEPVFCDLIVKRWELLTGKKATYENQTKN